MTRRWQVHVELTDGSHHDEIVEAETAIDATYVVTNRLRAERGMGGPYEEGLGVCHTDTRLIR